MRGIPDPSPKTAQRATRSKIGTSLKEETMITARKSVAGIVLLTFFFVSGVCFADPAIPSLVGTWTVKSQAVLMLKGDAPGKYTHYAKQVNTSGGEVVITKQDGRLLWGTFTSPKMTENFIAAIGFDNKSISLVDQDGFMDGTIVDNDTIQGIYRHAAPADSVLSVGTWSRKK